jgi:hypothetical protein
VLSFWHQDAPENVHFSIADAKRSEATNIVPYFSASVEAMAIYMVAFAGHLRSRLSVRGFEAPLKPTATLFLYQELVDRSSWALHNGWLAALGLNHFGKFGPNGEWKSEQIRDWFNALAHSAFESVSPD